MTEAELLANALDEGLRALEAGQPLEAVVTTLAARYPMQATELSDLLMAAAEAGAGQPAAPVPPRAQTASRAAFLTRAARRRRSAPPRRRGLGWLFAAALARPVLILLVFLAGFVGGTYGAVAASADALPGDALYTFKRTVERTQLLLTGDPKVRAELEAEFTERRLEEAQAVTTQGRETHVEFTGWLSALDGEHWTVSGLRVLVAAGTPISGTPVPGSWVHIAGAVQSDGVILAERVDALAEAEVPLPTATPLPASPTAPATIVPVPTVPAGEDVEFTGVVEAIGPAAWQIGGQTVRVNAATEIRDNPQVGQVVEVRAERQADGGLLATRIRLEDEEDGPAPTNTPGGGSGPTASNTPDGSATPDDDDDDDGGGPSPSNTPDPGDDDDGGGGGPSPSNTPDPGDDDDDDGGDGGGSGPSPSNTPDPGDDDDDDEGPGEGQAPTATLAPAGAGTPTPGETSEPQEFDFEGTLEAINGSAWTVGGQTVEVTGATEVRDNPQIGDRVRVRALRYADGRTMATRIEKED